jgi:hypothetical protein
MDQQNSPQVQGVTPTVALPSADLITYRFDQIDKSMSAMNVKLDLLTNNFITRKEADLLVKQGDEVAKEMSKRIDKMQTFSNAIIVAVIGALTMSIASVLIHR